jgi:hypothetical protein
VLFPDASASDALGAFDADLYVLGFQEIVDLGEGTSYLEEALAVVTDGWKTLIANTLNSGSSSSAKYRCISSRALVGVFLCVFAKEGLRPSIRNVMDTEVKSTFAGNKGGVGIRMQLYDSDVCFVCTHLAAKKDKVKKRNKDYAKIREGMKFTKKRNQDDEKQGGDALEMMRDHDMVFWLGDLNYRLNCTDLEDVHSRIEDGNWQSLLPEDQLNLARQDKSAFGGFLEHVIDFMPTYKFKPNTNDYVLTKPGTKEKRFPAWCDRILWRQGHKPTTDIGDVRCQRYSSSRGQIVSDHKPVFAQICFEANVFDQTRQEMLRRQIMGFGERQQPATVQRQQTPILQRHSAAQKSTEHQSAPPTPTATRQLTYEPPTSPSSSLTRASSHSEERKEQAERPMLFGARRKMTSLDYAAESYVSSLRNYDAQKAKDKQAKHVSELELDGAARYEATEDRWLDQRAREQQKLCGMVGDDTDPAPSSPVIDHQDD